MSLIRLCEHMAGMADQEPPEDADPEWVAIFVDLGNVCIATHEQIVADMGDMGSGQPEKVSITKNLITNYTELFCQL